MTVRQGLVTPVTPFATEVAAVSFGSVNPTGSVAFAANPNRKHGVWVQNVDTAHGTSAHLLVGTTTSDAAILLSRFGAATTSINATWILGTGPVYVKGSVTTTDWAGFEW